LLVSKRELLWGHAHAQRKDDAVHEFPAVPINFYAVSRFYSTVYLKVYVQINATYNTTASCPNYATCAVRN